MLIYPSKNEIHEAAVKASREALKWLETPPCGDLKADSVRAGDIAAKAILAASGPMLEARARAQITSMAAVSLAAVSAMVIKMKRMKNDNQKRHSDLEE